MATKYVSSLAAGGGSGTFGSPWTLAEAITNYTGGDEIRLIADGTYNRSSVITLGTAGGTAGTPTILTGANTSTGAVDGTRAVLRATAAITMLSATALYTEVNYIEFDGNSGTGTTAFHNSAGYTRMYKCKIHDFTNGAYSANSPLEACEIYNYTGTGLDLSGGAGKSIGCDIHDGTGGSSIAIRLGQGSEVLDTNIWKVTPGAGGVAGIYVNGSAWLIKDVRINDSTQNGIYIASGWGDIINTITARCTTYGFNAAATSNMSRLINCAGYSNTSGNVNANITNSNNFKTLTVDPFTSQSTGDLSLSTSFSAGGSGDLKTAAFPGAYPAGLATSYADIGIQHQDSGGGGITKFDSVF